MNEEIKNELRAMRAERRAIIEQYGDMAQRHPMHVHIGGLNPAAQRLHFLRISIAHLQSKLHGPRAKVTPKGSGSEWKRRGGLMYEVSFGGRAGMIGLSQGSPPHAYYLIERGEIVSSGYKTLSLATKAFERHVKGAVRQKSAQSRELDQSRELSQRHERGDNPRTGGYYAVISQDGVLDPQRFASQSDAGRYGNRRYGLREWSLEWFPSGAAGGSGSASAARHERGSNPRTSTGGSAGARARMGARADAKARPGVSAGAGAGAGAREGESGRSSALRTQAELSAARQEFRFWAQQEGLLTTDERTRKGSLERLIGVLEQSAARRAEGGARREASGVATVTARGKIGGSPKNPPKGSSRAKSSPGTGLRSRIARLLGK